MRIMIRRKLKIDSQSALMERRALARQNRTKPDEKRIKNRKKQMKTGQSRTKSSVREGDSALDAVNAVRIRGPELVCGVPHDFDTDVVLLRERIV